MPGRDQLAQELGVHGTTVKRALEQLEQEGLLKSAGAGKPRQITAQTEMDPLAMRVCIIPYEGGGLLNNYILELQKLLLVDGHTMAIAPWTLRGLKFDTNRVLKKIQEQTAEAFIVQAAPRPILEELSKLPTPTFALFGRMAGLPIAGSGADKFHALRDSMHYLHDNGHRRIVMLTRGRQQNLMGPIEQAFLEELTKWNLPHSAFNLPVWENSPDGLRKCLSSLFKITPPNAIFTDDWVIHHAIQNYLLNERELVSRNVVCICTDHHSSFGWCQPGVSHFHWNSLDLVRNAVRWVNSVATGKDDKRQKLVKAKFIPGE